MRNFSGPEHGVFCISVVDVISRNALILLSLLRAINYPYNKGPLKYEFFKCKTIHSGLLHIAILHSISLQWVIKKYIISIISRDHWRGTFAAIFHSHTMILVFRYVFIKMSWNFVFLKNTKSALLWYFLTEFFSAVKEIHKLQFRWTTSEDTKFLSPKPSKYWKTEHYWGSDDCVEVDINSDINCLSSGNLSQSTTLPSQCEWYPWTWTWCLLYFDRLSHFEKRPGIVYCFKCKKLSLQQGVSWSWVI